MTLPASGQITIAQIASEFGDAAPNQLNEFYGAHPSLPTSGQIAFNQFYGLTNYTATAYTNTFATGRSPSNYYVVGDTFTITSAGLYTFQNGNLDQVDIEARGARGGYGWGRPTSALSYTFYTGSNGSRVRCRMDIGALSNRTMEVRVATAGNDASSTGGFEAQLDVVDAGGTQGGGSGRSGGGGGGGRTYWAYTTTDTNELVVASGGGGGRATGLGTNGVRINGSAGCNAYSATLETDVSAAGGGGGYYGGASACSSGYATSGTGQMGNSGSGSNYIHPTYDVSITQNSLYNRTGGYSTGYFKMTVISVT